MSPADETNLRTSLTTKLTAALTAEGSILLRRYSCLSHSPDAFTAELDREDVYAFVAWARTMLYDDVPHERLHTPVPGVAPSGTEKESIYIRAVRSWQCGHQREIGKDAGAGQALADALRLALMHAKMHDVAEGIMELTYADYADVLEQAGLKNWFAVNTPKVNTAQ